MTTIQIPDELVPILLAWAEVQFAAQGAHVIRPSDAHNDAAPWMTPREFHRSLTPQIPYSTFTARLRSPSCPRFVAHRGPTGRLLRLQATKELCNFMALPQQPGQPL